MLNPNRGRARAYLASSLHLSKWFLPMVPERVLFISSLIFLIGVLMVTAAIFESVRERYPKIILHGFLLAILSFVIVGVFAFLIV